MGTRRSLTCNSYWTNRISSWVAHISVLVLLLQANLDVLGILGGVNGISGHLRHLFLLLLLLIDLILVAMLLLLKPCENSGAIIRLDFIIVIEGSLLEVILTPAVPFLNHVGILLSLVVWEAYVHFCVGK
jgi:hypothetical protein